MNNETVKSAANKFDTPLYLYDGDYIKNTYGVLRNYLHPKVDVYYSMKANPALAVCELLYESGANCEVCSLAEVIVALEAGFKPSQIIFVGPGKSTEELEYCIEQKIKAIVCESLDELIRLNNIARKHNVIVAVLLRINPDFMAKNAPLKMGGKPTQFGMDASILQKNINQIKQYSNLKIIGIHVYNGTRILDEVAIIENTQNILNLAAELTASWQIEFEYIDLGGGLGIPYFSGELALDLEKLFLGYNAEIEKYLAKHPKTKFILEAGRYLVGLAGVMVGRILSVKESHSEKFIINDAGMNCHLGASGLGSFVRRNFPIELISDLNAENDVVENYNIVGPLCTPGDVIGQHVSLPKPRVGDLIVVKNSGAYGPTASPVRFLSHGFPAEAIFLDGKIYLIRRRETVQDMMSTQLSLRSQYYTEKRGSELCQLIPAN